MHVLTSEEVCKDSEIILRNDVFTTLWIVVIGTGINNDEKVSRLDAL